MGNLSKKDAEEGAREFEAERTGERDSSKEFARAGHQARNDAVGTDFEVREAKEATESSSTSSTDDEADSNADEDESAED